MSHDQKRTAPGMWGRRGVPNIQKGTLSLGATSLTFITDTGGPDLHCALTSLYFDHTAPVGNVFYIDAEKTEYLIIHDPDMIAALKKAHKPARPYRPIGVWTLGLVLSVLAITGFYQIPYYAHYITTAAVKNGVTTAILAHIETTIGAPCHTDAQAATLAQITGPISHTDLIILPLDGIGIIPLPGGRSILPAGLMIDSTGPADLIRHVVRADHMRLVSPPMQDVYTFLGPYHSLRILMTGVVAKGQIAPLTQHILTPTPHHTAEYNGGYDTPVIADGAWLALQAICQN
ncbi:MAG: hypothetical protein AAF701_07205 [Pseudomonadota bacterium]